MGERYPKKREAFYGTGRWKALRKAALIRDHYWCVRCRRRPATTVHHVIPRTERPDLEMELDNLESLCPQCHEQVHPDRGGKKNQGVRETPGAIRVIVI